MAQLLHQPRSSGDNVPGSGAVSSLIAMADYFLTQNPQRISEAIKCLLASLSLSPPPRVEAKVKLQLGLTLYHHSNNLLEARQALEQAMLSSKSITGIEEIRFEAASLLGRIHIEQGYAHHAKKVLKSVMDTSHRFPYWHCRLLLQKADIHVYERDVDGVVSTLTQAADYAHHVQAPYTRILCLLCKGAHLLINKQYQEAAAILSSSCALVEGYSGPKATLLKTFYMVIQVTHLLGAGLMKTAKPHLKQLQQCVKLLNSEPNQTGNPGLDSESFEWLTKEQTYVLVYLVCIMHSVLAGHTEKALSFSKKAMDLVEQNRESSPVMVVFRAHLLELIIVCLLMQGNMTQAGEKLQEVVGVCQSHSQLVYSHRAVLHTLLGLYAFATNCLEESISQFYTALQHTNSNELRTFININLAICYMKQGPKKEKELLALIESFESDSATPPSCKNLKGALSFMRGLYAHSQVKLHEAKRHLRETLSISNNNDLNKLTVCSLVILGQIFLSLGNTKETQDMVGPAFQLSIKISDKRLQVWASSLLVELHHATGNREAEKSAKDTLTKTKNEIAKECSVSMNSPYHQLIQWTIGDWPVSKISKSPPKGEEEVIDEEVMEGGREEQEKMEVDTKQTIHPDSNHVEPPDSLVVQIGSNLVEKLTHERNSGITPINNGRDSNISRRRSLENVNKQEAKPREQTRKKSNEHKIEIERKHKHLKDGHPTCNTPSITESNTHHLLTGNVQSQTNEDSGIIISNLTSGHGIQPPLSSTTITQSSSIPLPATSPPLKSPFSSDKNVTHPSSNISMDKSVDIQKARQEHSVTQPLSYSSSPPLEHMPMERYYQQLQNQLQNSQHQTQCEYFEQQKQQYSHQQQQHGHGHQQQQHRQQQHSQLPIHHQQQHIQQIPYQVQMHQHSPLYQSQSPHSTPPPSQSPTIHTPPRHVSPLHQSTVIHVSPSQQHGSPQHQNPRIQSPPLSSLTPQALKGMPFPSRLSPNVDAISPEIHSGYSSPVPDTHLDALMSRSSPMKLQLQNLQPNQLFNAQEQARINQLRHHEQLRQTSYPHIPHHMMAMQQSQPFPRHMQLPELQYSYRALSPEAILRQREQQSRLLHHQQQQSAMPLEHSMLHGVQIMGQSPMMPGFHSHPRMGMMSFGQSAGSVLDESAMMSHQGARHIHMLQNLSQNPSRTNIGQQPPGHPLMSTLQLPAGHSLMHIPSSLPYRPQ